MKSFTPRLRMFAGPNGSGKSSIKALIGSELIGNYINPDEIEADMSKNSFIDFHNYSIITSLDEVVNFFNSSVLLKKTGFKDNLHSLKFFENKLIFQSVNVNAYLASIVADFIRKNLIKNQITFTFETVMSSEDKIDLLHKAQKRGYRNYLYYVATDDPEINVTRIRHRVKMGGHDVPYDKIISRYGRSLELLIKAVQYTNRAYIFDNSSHELVLLAEITDGHSLEMKTTQMPIWFKNALWDKFKQDP